MNRKRSVEVVASILLLLLSATLIADEPASDHHITHSLRESFKRDFRLKDADIEVSTMFGEVTLRGCVVSFAEKRLAEQFAKKIDGVRRVMNAIQVDPQKRTDDELTMDVKRRLNQSSFIRPAGWQIRVDSGVVTVTGTVDTRAQSRHVQRVVTEVRGVRLVRNQLVALETAAAGNDESIKREVESKLSRDARVAALPIRVAVEKGVVVLQGEVPYLFHKDRAAQAALRAEGVKTIKNRLEVVSQSKLREAPVPPNDKETTEAVLEELKADPRVTSKNIRAAASDGGVMLAGSAPTMFERRMAERIARRVYGVARVENQIEVSAVARGDDEILDDLQFNISSDALLSDQPIEVQVKGGKVTLTGKAANTRSKTHAERLAARVRGVRAIDSELKIEREPDE